jgi:hypothetical protein
VDSTYLVTILLKISFNLLDLIRNHGTIITGKGFICHLTQLSLIAEETEAQGVNEMLLKIQNTFF